MDENDQIGHFQCSEEVIRLKNEIESLKLKEAIKDSEISYFIKKCEENSKEILILKNQLNDYNSKLVKMQNNINFQNNCLKKTLIEFENFKIWFENQLKSGIHQNYDSMIKNVDLIFEKYEIISKKSMSSVSEMFDKRIEKSERKIKILETNLRNRTNRNKMKNFENDENDGEK